MNPPHLEVVLVCGYALFLLVAGSLLELAAGHVHRRAQRWHTGGFTYHHHLDAWECPEGQRLWPKEVDHELRLIRYRAKAEICNACPIKNDCTDASDGREVTVALDPWPHSEAGRFHRGMSLVLVVLAAAFLGVEAVRHHGPGDLAALAGMAGVIAAIGWWMVRAFRANPAGFPGGGPAPANGAPRRPGWSVWTPSTPVRARRWGGRRG
jgi:hypothetical protein